MSWRRAAPTALLATLALAATSLAERAPEDRTTATHVIRGAVEGVYVRARGEFNSYVIELAVKDVEKGKGVKPGDTLYVRCYLWNADHYKGKKLSEKEKKQIALRWSSYDGVPKEGEQVRVYLKLHSGKHDGVYPNWYDPVKRK
jgi:hypothetical protein